jgi:hypothetical protein
MGEDKEPGGGIEDVKTAPLGAFSDAAICV